MQTGWRVSGCLLVDRVEGSERAGVRGRGVRGGRCAGAGREARGRQSAGGRGGERTMLSRVWVCVALVAAAASAARRPEQDFEFDEGSENGAARRPRRYLYDPHNTLCRSLVCKKREVCLLRDAFTALCANKKDILRRGDSVVVASGAWDAEPDDDIFYEDPTDPLGLTPDANLESAVVATAADDKLDRCVGCPVRGRGEFLCGSDNRTYSSLCRLDLHNCVRRAHRPVALACRGFCPCPAPPAAPPAPPRRPHRPRARPRARARPRLAHRYEEEWRRSELAHNDVLPERASECALDEMANRLLDWFSVLMEEAGATAPPSDGFPDDCKPEVRWMFTHLDADGDGILSALNLYSLRHDERERCLRPFLSSCGGEGGGGGGVSRAAWCGCLRRAARPCRALARAHPAPHAGAYVPSCDARGFYRARQCHAALGVCWCVDPHGVEVAGSRTKGAPACAGGAGGARGEGAPADDEDAGGSGDRDLHY